LSSIILFLYEKETRAATGKKRKKAFAEGETGGSEARSPEEEMGGKKRDDCATDVTSREDHEISGGQISFRGEGEFSSGRRNSGAKHPIHPIVLKRGKGLRPVCPSGRK